MKLLESLRFAFQALTGFRLRSILMVLAMSIGVASVMILTGIGEGARGYVSGQFASLGTHMLIVIPGRTETGGAGAAFTVPDTPRDLTLDDAIALRRSAHVSMVAPVVLGSGLVSAKGRERDIPILGSTRELFTIRHWELSQGTALPEGDLQRDTPVCVLGSKVRKELFGADPVLGEWLRVGDRRMRIIGVLRPGGMSVGVDVDDVVLVPVATAQALFNSPSLFRIMVSATRRESIEPARRFVRDTLRERHQGEEDVTVITQDAVLATFDQILGALTLAVGGIGAISLVVAGILVMNVMLVAVSQRTAEIGLLKALGARRSGILQLFLYEAVLLCLLGAVVGTLVGQAGVWALASTYPQVPVATPLWAWIAGVSVAVVTGVLFGVLPARRAADLDPVTALSRR
ncbi:MAG: ABC transporter permease [Gammaproteobacteria bacterium]|nr:ABC transporter permease [Gammaproteobacteria bacterium]